MWRDAIVTDKLDKSIELDRAILPNGVTYDANTRVLTWQVGDLAGGQSRQITFKVKVVSLTNDHQIVNIAKVSGTDKDGNHFDTSDEADVAIDSNQSIAPKAPNNPKAPSTPSFFNSLVKKLPQTGEAALKGLPYVGVLIILIVIGLIWYRRKQHTK